MKIGVLIILCLSAMATAKKSYEGYKVFSTERLSEKQVSLLRKVEKTGHFDFWKGPLVGHKADIMASPEKVDMLTRILTKEGIEHIIVIEDVASLIDTYEYHPMPKKHTSNVGNAPRYSLDWETFHPYDTIVEFMDELAAAHDFVSVVSLGPTEEGRDLRLLSIGKAGPGAKNVIVEGGAHAREWISPAVVTYVIRELVENHDSHPEYLDNLNFHFVPVANPDGYDYSHTDDRLWRKNRAEHPNSTCYGTDLNRNWDIHWGEIGTGAHPCTQTWPGSGAFSELESQHMSNYFWGLDPMPELAMVMHSYGEMWLYPYGWDYLPDEEQPENNEESIALAKATTFSLNAVHGENFTAMNGADLYPASGAADDWYKFQGVRFAYTVELRGPYFLIPNEEIVPSGEEMWAAFKVLFDKLLEE